MRRLTIALVIAVGLACLVYAVHGQPPREPSEGGEDRPPSRRADRRKPDDRDGRRERGPAKAAPAKSGVVKQFTKNPEGEIDGLQLDDGTEVRFRPEAGERVQRGISLQDRVTIEGWTHSGESQMHAATIQIESSGKTLVVDRPPPELSEGGRPSRRGGEEDDADDRRPGPKPDEDEMGPRQKPEPKSDDSRPGRTVQSANARPANPAPAAMKPSPSQHAEPSPIPGFMRIPAGEFEMGDHHGFVDPKHGGDETPIHRVRLDAFDIGIYDVTTQQYCRFLNAALAQSQIEVRQGGVYLAGGADLLCDTRTSSPSSPIGWDGQKFAVLDHRENHPMVCVRWHGAVVCCNWLSAQKGFPACYDTSSWDCDFTKSGFRLPTEAEWEYAARGGLQKPYYNYPWGSDADPMKANVPESRNPFRAGPRPWTTPVGFFNGKLHRKADWGWPGEQQTFQTADGANGFGLYDMAGNVWEWCTEWYDRHYYAYAPSDNPPGPAAGSRMPDGKSYRCMRGGSWSNGEFGHSRVSNRDPSYFRGPDPVTRRNDPDGPWFHIGFRVVHPVDAEKRPVVKPTPVQQIEAQDSSPGGERRPRPGQRSDARPSRGDAPDEDRPMRPKAKRPSDDADDDRTPRADDRAPRRGEESRGGRRGQDRPGNPNDQGRQGAQEPRGGAPGAHNNRTPTSPNPGQTVGLFLNTPKACDGYTLFAPKHNRTIYLLDNQGRIVHQWKSEYEPGQSVYLKPNGNLLHCCFTKNRGFTSGGEGGRVEEFDWDGKIVWEFEHSTDQHLSHHDIAPLPNGNILLLVVEKKSYDECLAAGFNPEMLRDQQLFPDSVIEVQPTYPRGGKIVWQWRAWDHLIQDYDRTKANYGDVAAHPERIDVHCNGRAVPAFWNHMNSIAYNAKLDQIVLSVRGCNEIWFLDHSTTTGEASGRSGGKHGKGGDLIYRWGNPAAYKRGTIRDKQLVQQHDAQWIPDGSPGAGHVTIFNNGYDRGWSSIEEIVPPVDENGRYVIEPGKPYGPDKPVWHYEAPNRNDFFSSEISGAHRLPNGNTLICAGVIGHLFEVTAGGETVWQYVNPMVRGGILAQGELPGKDVRAHLFNAVFKVHRYPANYPGLNGRDLAPKGVVELPASQKGKTGLDQADAPSNERPGRVGGKDAQGGDRPRGKPGRGPGGRRPEGSSQN